MPEYLTPGVYLEETSFRSRSIEGVATSTFGMAGLTRYGPVPYVATMPNGTEVAMVPGPVLVSSLTEFQRAFGGLGDVGEGDDTRNYLAYAARAYFGNGGQRLYVSRVFPFAQANNAVDVATNFAALPIPAGANPPVATWRARWPGAAGQEISVRVVVERGSNVIVAPPGGTQRLVGVSSGAAVEVFADADALKTANTRSTPPANLRIVAADPVTKVLGYRTANGVEAAGTGGAAAAHVTVRVTVRWGDRSDVYAGLELDRAHPRSIHKVLDPVDPTDEFSLVWLDVAEGNNAPAPEALLGALLSLGTDTYLIGGNEQALTAAVIAGQAADSDNPKIAATGLAALADQEDVAIVASPDAIRLPEAERITATNDLIIHATAPKAYRIAIVDPPRDSSISEVREFRSQFDTAYAALYYPWVQIVDPTAKVDPNAGPALIDLPPSGFVAGVYARSTIERGVHKAPANEVVLGITKFIQNVTYERQSVLNPEGINALRFFEGRANRVWGARTMSSDPEWKYVNVRRLFNYLEHSIDRSTQYAVFEPNNEQLWAKIRQSIEDFLEVTWKSGALMGTRPEEAFFVRCDRTTMTQNDLDNGRLICLIGVAPTYPAEFVIFRIGQWTADAPQN